MVVASCRQKNKKEGHVSIINARCCRVAGEPEVHFCLDYWVEGFMRGGLFPVLFGWAFGDWFECFKET